jgi:hypothetical protein
MMRPLTHPGVARPLLRGICLVVTGDAEKADGGAPKAVVARFPQRPDGRVLSETIPLFFVGRNTNGLWLAREAEARTGGLFLLKRSALRFARKNSAPLGCATIFLKQRFALDVENEGGSLTAGLDAAITVATRSAPKLIAAVAATLAAARNFFGGEYR